MRKKDKAGVDVKQGIMSGALVLQGVFGSMSHARGSS